MFPTFKRLMGRVLLAAACLLGASSQAHAGIPVLDVANLMQTIQQVLNDATEIENQVAQIENQLKQLTTLEDQLEAIKGFRGWGTLLNSPALKNYIPANAQNLINGVTTGGYRGLSGTARALRDATMLYNCEDLEGAEQTRCQAILAQPYQHKGLMQDALAKASGRLEQIDSLLQQVNESLDPKQLTEIQARITAENALLGHEMSQLQAAHYMAQAERETQASQQLERRLDNLRRTQRVSEAY